MFTVTASAEIDRPVEQVFAVAGDYRHDPTWRRGVVAMEHEPPGPPHVGTRTRETMRMFGRPAVTVAEVLAVDEGRRTAFRSVEGPIACEGSRTFEPVGSRTRFTYSLTLQPEGLLRWVELLMRPIFERQIRGDLARLKALVETGSADESRSART